MKQVAVHPNRSFDAACRAGGQNPFHVDRPLIHVTVLKLLVIPLAPFLVCRLIDDRHPRIKVWKRNRLRIQDRSLFDVAFRSPLGDRAVADRQSRRQLEGIHPGSDRPGADEEWQGWKG